MGTLDTLFCYHKNCPDGAGSMFAAMCYLTELSKVDKDFDLSKFGFYPIGHEEDGSITLPEESSQFETIYFLDFAPRRNKLLELKVNQKIVVVDHHVTAKKDLEGIDNTFFDMTKSSAVLTWEHFFDGIKAPKAKVPNLFLYLQDRDLWANALPFTKEINSYLLSLGRDADDLNDWSLAMAMLEDPIEKHCPIVQNGNVILMQNQNYIKNIIKLARYVKFHGLIVPCVNAHYHLCSDWLAILAKQSPSKVAISWHQDSTGKYKYSLRSSSDEVDVSLLAVIEGGGGHKKAAGFSTSHLVHKELTEQELCDIVSE